jgi:hypothetical protein
LAANALAEVNALKRVDLPTFGKPTIPHCKPIFQVFMKNLNENSRKSSHFKWRLKDLKRILPAQ